ncbi:hypothetical protein HCA82_11470 [Listeria innocua]|uniref:hypothetical protein n=1 Tax=Listeria innocua TaxID=1642 RepID=UPI0016293CAE|nr:hypothetical protein [Listeria innocua]MBC2111679.1 hypothetical protein [Listeria innocua]
MKKVLMPLMLLAVLLYGCSSQNEGVTKETAISKTISIRADYTIPANLDELAANSDSIVKVKFLQNKDIGKNGNTISEVEILKNYKGNFKKGEKVDISEPWYLSNDKYVAVENYIALEKNEEYTLFLNEGDDKVSSIVSMGYGKFSEKLQEKQSVLADFDKLGEVQKYDFISESKDEVKNYQAIKQQVFEKYQDSK